MVDAASGPNVGDIVSCEGQVQEIVLIGAYTGEFLLSLSGLRHPSYVAIQLVCAAADRRDKETT